MTLPHRLDRTITIQAPREFVFSYFTDSSRWAAWWGAGSTIEPRAGGRVLIRYPGNVEVSGDVISIAEPDRLVFTYGYASGQPFPPGASRVTITLAREGTGTRLQLTHEFPDAASRDQHIQGWRYQLSLFSNAILNALHVDAEDKVDAWFGLWTEPDPAARASTLQSIASDAVVFRDRYSLTDGAGDLSEHIAAAQKFMPGIQLKRRGSIRQCQGTVIADWDAVGNDSAPRGKGSNVFVFGADGKITSATGFWN